MRCASIVRHQGIVTLQVVSSTTCTESQIVLLYPDEYARLANSPWNLSVADGSAIGASILAVWAVGFGIRWAVRALRVTDSSSLESD